METNVKPKAGKARTEAQKDWDALKLNMTTEEFEAYIHKIEEGEFMSLDDSKRSFFQWVRERKQ